MEKMTRLIDSAHLTFQTGSISPLESSIHPKHAFKKGLKRTIRENENSGNDIKSFVLLFESYH